MVALKMGVTCCKGHRGGVAGLCPMWLCLAWLAAVTLTAAAPLSQSVALTMLSAKAAAGNTGITSCQTCKIVFSVIDAAYEANSTEEEIVLLAQKICVFLSIEDVRVCQTVVLEFKDELLEVILKEILTPDQACGFLLGTACDTPYLPKENWTVPLPDVPKPPIVPPQPPQPGSPILRVLHISDLHYDIEYTPGAVANCNEPLCCRSSDGFPSDKADGAWQFGDYRGCDTPLWTIESLFQHAAETGEFDAIYWTGDLPAHNVWNQTRPDQLALVQTLTKLLNKYFPGKLIFAAVGNHESSPVNSFPQPFITGDEAISWLYNALATSWMALGLPTSAESTITFGGYYAVPAYPGLRVISLNMNYCTFGNWWLYLNATDPADMLQWLVQQLATAEMAGDKVHIIGHHHPSSCYTVWGENYRQIIYRYESIVTGQFFGHSHTDSYAVFYEADTSRPFSVTYIGPSVTAYSGLNSGYRIYSVDGNYSKSSWMPLDLETYILDLKAANDIGIAIWQREYTAKLNFALPDLLPSSWSKLTFQMAMNQSLFDLYRGYYYKLNLPSDACDDSCRHSMLCDTMNVVSGDDSQCARLPMQLSASTHLEGRRRSARSLC